MSNYKKYFFLVAKLIKEKRIQKIDSNSQKFRMVIDESLKYMNSDRRETGLLKSLTFIVAMSFHSIMEGFALGVQVIFKINEQTF